MSDEPEAERALGPHGPFSENAAGFIPKDGIDPSALQSGAKVPDWLCRVAILVLFANEYAAIS